MQKIIITGGTGMIGKALTGQLVAKGYGVIIFTRKPPKDGNNQPQIQYTQWDVNKKIIEPGAIGEADFIIHLAGAGVMDKRWTAAHKKEIQDSRIKSSEFLVETLRSVNNHVKAVVSASAIGWYGSDEKYLKDPKGFVETDEAATGFLGETCRLWEDSIAPVQQTGKRLVKLRTGIVLSNEGGAFAEFKRPVQFGIAGILGSGKQIISWIHIQDLCRMYIQALENDQVHGAYNAVAPSPVSNKIFTLELAKKMKGRFFIPLHVPAIALKIFLGESSIEVLKSTTVNCNKMLQSGFSFHYPSLEKALDQLCKK